MRVAVTGATGVMGRSAVSALLAAGHDVVALARTPEKAALVEGLGAAPVLGTLFDAPALTRMFDGCDAVCNLATHIPIGLAAARRGAWRQNDRLRTEGVRTVVAAARAARVRRLVQESVSFLYADHGEEWINEESSVEINVATEPASVGESYVRDFQSPPRHGVVLRFGRIVGDDRLTRWMLHAVARSRAVGMGTSRGWVHLVHTDDLGGAVAAALHAPSGTYNVGAEPVRGEDLMRGLAHAAGREEASFLGPLATRLAGPRVEPLRRSLRICSENFTAKTGWAPSRPTFDDSWFDVARPSVGASL